MSENLQDIIDGALDDLRAWCKDNPEGDPSYDGTLDEFVDGAVPIYHADLLDLAASDNEIALTAPELGPAYDGEPTPINIIAANVYEAVSNALHAEWQEIETRRDADECMSCGIGTDDVEGWAEGYCPACLEGS